MKTVDEIMAQLERLGSDSTKRIYKNHGAREPLFGVKIGDLKKLLKGNKNNHELALQLYDTGNSDAMYLAALMADKNKITKDQLRVWMKKATWYMLSEHSVGALAAESPYALELAREWMASENEMTEAAGWSVYAGYISLVDERDLDLAEVETLLERAGQTLHDAKNRVRYTMNSFIIAVGGYVESLSEKALDISRKIGTVSVNLGDTACKVPYATEYIQKMVARGSFGKRQKMVRC